MAMEAPEEQIVNPGLEATEIGFILLLALIVGISYIRVRHYRRETAELRGELSKLQATIDRVLKIEASGDIDRTGPEDFSKRQKKSKRRH